MNDATQPTVINRAVTDTIARAVSVAAAETIDLDDVRPITHTVLGVGDPTADGTLSVTSDDEVVVWAGGVDVATAQVTGAYEHFRARSGTATRTVAQAVTVGGYGGREVYLAVQRLDDEGMMVDEGDPFDRRPLDEDGRPPDPSASYDDLVASMGYRIVGAWETTPYGMVSTVEPTS